MKYYLRMGSNPKNEKTYGKPVGLARLDPPQGISDFWDREAGKWKEDTYLLKNITGMGGDGSEWTEVKKDKAAAFIARVSPDVDLDEVDLALLSEDRTDW